MAASLGVIIILGLFSDWLFRRLRMPGLVGMLLAGVVCGPHALNLLGPEIMSVSGDFRKIAPHRDFASGRVRAAAGTPFTRWGGPPFS